VFCLRLGCNLLDPVSVSRVAFRPDLRLSSPYDDYWRHFYFATPSDVQLIELSATMHYINDSIAVLAVRDRRGRTARAEASTFRLRYHRPMDRRGHDNADACIHPSSSSCMEDAK